MSGFKAQIVGAAQVVENTMLSVTRDFTEGVASFLTGNTAHTHDPEPVGELEAEKKEALATERQDFIDTNFAQQVAQESAAEQQAATAQQSQETDNDYGR